jgi:hypothetical protein
MPGQTLTKKKQLLILAGAAAAFLPIDWVWQHAGELFARVALPGDDPASRLACVAHGLLLPGLTLLGGSCCGRQSPGRELRSPLLASTSW